MNEKDITNLTFKFLKYTPISRGDKPRGLSTNSANILSDLFPKTSNEYLIFLELLHWRASCHKSYKEKSLNKCFDNCYRWTTTSIAKSLPKLQFLNAVGVTATMLVAICRNGDKEGESVWIAKMTFKEIVDMNRANINGRKDESFWRSCQRLYPPATTTLAVERKSALVG